MGPTTTTWTKSSYCASGDCVEVAAEADRIFIRDGKNPQQGSLEVTRAEWHDFLGLARVVGHAG